ncbi:conserved hypothetical protein [Flavobacterium sp. 9AF]|uniref:T9SS type A sorting domain-containing protein n=1 Tax=Flavobacterium sp. 9AF TaxID=2653142 RepID=UPI0012F38E0F|nr:T9SS type A sorting domain-containing protein [Flavobacterium sp. 9AF]VXB34371.1 conserved hypothetical protein [Flavobacterium sp. 9AF]
MRKQLFIFLLFPILGIAQVEQILNFYWAYPTKVNNKIVFVRTEPTFGNELWVTDGTTAGTTILMDIVIGAGSSNPYLLTVIDDVIYFQANTDEIWRTDGTTGGTYKMVDNNAITNPSGFTKANGFIFFTEGNNTNRSLWRMQTTPNSEVQITQGDSQILQNIGFDLVALNDNAILFNAYTSAHRWAIWRTNGIVSEMIADLFPNTSPDMSQMYYGAKKIGNKVYFPALSEQYGGEYFTTDGTVNGTSLLKDIFVSASYYDSSTVSENGFVEVGSNIFFVAKDNTNGLELWKTDGTNAGTLMVKDITPGNNNSSWSPGGLTAFNNQLYFNKNDGANGSQIWKTDGTENGTIMITTPTVNNIFSNELFVSQGFLFFSSYTSNNTTGIELWMLDSNDQAFLIQDIAPGNASSSPAQFMELNGYVYFNASVDGTYAGTKVFRINPQTLATTSFATEDIQMFPNPTEDFVTLNLENSETYQIKVFNVEGQQLNLRMDNNTIDFTSVPTGIYYITVLDTSTDKKNTKKIIKK